MLFCYGTPMPLARGRGGRPARSYGRLYDNGSYPAAMRGEPGGTMIADIVSEVTDEGTERLDAHEGVAHEWYQRVRRATVDGEDVWVYGPR